MARISLYQQYCAEQARAKITNTQRAGKIFWTFGAMLTGQIKSGKGDGGFAGLKAPMAYSTFLFMFVILPILVLIAFLTPH
jgi:hypothetical protein